MKMKNREHEQATKKSSGKKYMIGLCINEL